MRITARQMCVDLVSHQMETNRWGGVGYITMRTPMMDVRFDKETFERIIKPRMRKFHETEFVDMMGPDGSPLLYKSKGKGHEKGDVRKQGKPNPFWDFENDCGKVVKVSSQQVQVGFDWTKVLQIEQMNAGLEPDFESGLGAPNWRKETRFVEAKIDDEWKKTLFFYRLDVTPEGKVRDFDVRRSSIYLSCLKPKHPILPFAMHYEQICDGMKIRAELLKEWLLAKQDEDAKAEAQGHPDRPDLNRDMFSPKIENILSLSVFGKRYTIPKRNWGDVNPVNFADVELIVEDDDMTLADGTVNPKHRTGYAEEQHPARTPSTKQPVKSA